jgi:hypothetical protein
MEKEKSPDADPVGSGSTIELKNNINFYFFSQQYKHLSEFGNPMKTMTITYVLYYQTHILLEKT